MSVTVGKILKFIFTGLDISLTVTGRLLLPKGYKWKVGAVGKSVDPFKY